MIVVACAECGSKIRAKTEYAGRTAKCPKCQSAVIIPEPAEDIQEGAAEESELIAAPARRSTSTGKKQVEEQVARPPSQAASPELRRRILQSLDQHIEPVKTTLTYRLAIIVVAMLMILLPIIYISLIGLVGYGAYWHLTHNTGMLHANVKGKGQVMLFLAYATPGIMGAVLVAFMLKPLFARRPKPDDLQTVLRDDEPFLFEFIDRLCDAVGSPRPKSILLNSEVNAAAALISGAWNPFRHDLMLVIGLPLAAGMTLRQLAGILAHEFGHFSQGAGMRLGGIINSVNRWFAFVVYQRDEWDLTLERWSKEVDIQIGWVIYVTRGGVWLTRKILHGLMLVGHAMSCRLAREMEFDADRHEARLAGSTSFAQTSQGLLILNGARQWAISDLSESYRERRLVDDFFSLINYRAEQIPPETREKVREQQLQSKTGWFDTHPCDADRIASVDREPTSGLLNIDAPAAVLFRDFSETCRAETKKFYQSQLGDAVSATNLVPMEVLLARQKAAVEEDKAVARVMYGNYHFFWTLPLPKFLAAPTEPSRDRLAEIRGLRQRIATYGEAHGQAMQKLGEAFVRLQHANLAEALLNAKMTIGKDIFTPPMTNRDQVASVRQQQLATREETLHELAPVLEDLADRLRIPLQILGEPAIEEKLPNAGELWEEASRLLKAEAQLREVRDDFLTAYTERELLRDLFKQLQMGASAEMIVPELLKATAHSASTLGKLRTKLNQIEYPFDHVEEGIKVGKYLIEKVPANDDPGAAEGTLTYAADEGLLISSRVIGRLCVIVETVETALGLPLGEEPPKEEPPKE